MAGGMGDYEAAVAPLKAALFGQLLSGLGPGGSLLEIGLGTGPNFPFYASAAQQAARRGPCSVVGLEPNPAMWPYAREAAAAAGFAAGQLQLLGGDAADSGLQEGSMDAAVLTLVLCSVRDPAAVLAETLRVLKPGGLLLLLEHVAAPDSQRLLQLQQLLLDPLQRALADNCSLRRQTAAVVAASGFAAVPLDSSVLRGAPGPALLDDASGLLHFEVPGMGLIAPHVAGLLAKPA